MINENFPGTWTNTCTCGEEPLEHTQQLPYPSKGIILAISKALEDEEPSELTWCCRYAVGIQLDNDIVAHPSLQECMCVSADLVLL